MNYLTSDTKKLVVYFQPYHATTTGHTTIRNVVKEVLDDQTVLVTFTTAGQLRDWLERTPQGPDLLLVDFPDTGYRNQLRAIQTHRKMDGVPIAGIDMFTPPRDPDPSSPFEYDLRFAFDPYSSDDERPIAKAWADVGPLLLNERLVLDNPSPRANHTLLDQVLICETGSNTEREHLTVFASRNRVNKSFPIVRSRAIPKADLLITALISKEIWAAGGYSMTWELAAYVPLERVNWMLLDRPSEDCARRVVRAMKMQNGNGPLLFRDDRPLTAAKFRFMGAMRDLLHKRESV
jgi:hypothetical protein